MRGKDGRQRREGEKNKRLEWTEIRNIARDTKGKKNEGA